ncbi:hypothetical protein B0H14DRAFT_2630237 [Mycena olivaceomarginata]|nr:hypothetical protein B0H14DRAFT_2630237 [Mycena olivaceomarginata]
MQNAIDATQLFLSSSEHAKDHNTIEAETASTVPFAATPLHIRTTLHSLAQLSTTLERQLSTKSTGSPLPLASIFRILCWLLHANPSSLAVVSPLDACWTFDTRHSCTQNAKDPACTCTVSPFAGQRENESIVKLKRETPNYYMLPDDLEHFHNILRTTKYSSSLIKNYRFGPTCEFDHVSKGTSSLNSSNRPEAATDARLSKQCGTPNVTALDLNLVVHRTQVGLRE